MSWGRGGLRNVLSVVDTKATRTGIGYGPIDEPATTVLEALKAAVEEDLARPKPVTLDQMAADIESRQRRIASIEAAIVHEQSALQQEQDELEAIQAEFATRISPLVRK